MMGTDTKHAQPIKGLTGEVKDIRIAVEAPKTISALGAGRPDTDINLKRMAEWAMNYLSRTPRPNLGWEPVFQCHPLKCPPVPAGHDVVVPCDTDARMEWEWYFMRDITGSTAARDVEKAFHGRMRDYVQEDGTVLAPPGCYNEGDINAVFEKKDYVYHMWGATKILKSLSEDFMRTKNPASKELARKVMLRLKGLSHGGSNDGRDAVWFPGGMAAVNGDGSLLSTGWSINPAPIVEPLLTYFEATGDAEGLAFARAYAEGIIGGLQPGGVRFKPDGRFDEPLGHSHAIMHSLWGISHLGVVTGEQRYLEFSRRAWDWMLSRGTGTGWFPAMPDSCNETCCVSDMISNACLFGQGGHPEYFDFAERYMRNYISTLQFVVTPEFEKYYASLNAAAGAEAIQKGLAELRKFQGGIIGGSGLNDYENELLGRVSGFEMFGCCAPEGMRAIHTVWSSTIARWKESAHGPAGVYVNMGFSRESPWGEVVSFFPDVGRLTVIASIKDAYFVRPPHWASRGSVAAFVGTRSVPVRWSGDYVRFDASPGEHLSLTYPILGFTHTVSGIWPQTSPKLTMRFDWLGNMVTGTDPLPEKTPLFTGKPRRLPPAPALP
jgi:hypothetical protein